MKKVFNYTIHYGPISNGDNMEIDIELWLDADETPSISIVNARRIVSVPMV